MKIPDKCICITTDSNIKFEEHKCAIFFTNPQRKTCSRICIDGCVITEGLRCDNLLIDWNGNEYFVELKGSDISHAIKQIEATIPLLHKAGAQIKAFIIHKSRSPQFTTEIQRAKKRLQQRYGDSTILSTHKSPHTVNLN